MPRAIQRLKAKPSCFIRFPIKRPQITGQMSWQTTSANHIRGEATMLFAVIGTTAGKSRDEIMAIYPRHKAFLDQFIARGEVVGVGPFTDAAGGNMALFRSREAAEAFAKEDPFLLEGVVKEYQIKDWGDQMLS
jgi:hypothetical protein